jgi:hypothetical protein
MLKLRPGFRPSEGRQRGKQGGHKRHRGNAGILHHSCPSLTCTEMDSIVAFGDQENILGPSIGRQQHMPGLDLGPAGYHRVKTCAHSLAPIAPLLLRPRASGPLAGNLEYIGPVIQHRHQKTARRRSYSRPTFRRQFRLLVPAYGSVNSPGSRIDVVRQPSVC